MLLDSEGIDAWDQVHMLACKTVPAQCTVNSTDGCWHLQTAQYSTQIFSLAVLLSSLFVYNQMGGIDEGALDKLSLVTEMTKHIRVRSGEVSAMHALYVSSQCNLTCLLKI